MRDITPKEIEWWNKFQRTIKDMPKNLRIKVGNDLTLWDENFHSRFDSLETKKIISES